MHFTNKEKHSYSLFSNHASSSKLTTDEITLIRRVINHLDKRNMLTKNESELLLKLDDDALEIASSINVIASSDSYAKYLFELLDSGKLLELSKQIHAEYKQGTFDEKSLARIFPRQTDSLAWKGPK